MMNPNCGVERFCPICKREEVKGEKKPFQDLMRRPSWIERLKRFFS